MNNANYSARIIDLLGLECPPLAAKFLKPGEPVPEGHDNTKKMRYCQALMMGKHGHKVLINGENITCPASASAFGFKPLPEKLQNGQMMTGMGLFGNPAAAAKTIALMPRMKSGECAGVLVAPLAQADFTPDVVVLEGKPEKLMWVALADIFEAGGRHGFQTGVFQATCIDATLVPYQTGKLNANLGCYGCRDATDIPEVECLLGFPAGSLDKIVGGLEKLAEKAIPRSRAKGAYKSMAACDGQH